MKFTNYNEFVKMANGKTVDIDGYYGAQCWDAFAWYCQLQGYPIINCTISGYVKDITTTDATNGILKNFIDIKNVSNMEVGDWVVFGNTQQTPDSHIAMYIGNNTYFSQNQNGVSKFTKVKFNAVGIIGIYRDKAFRKIPIKTSGVAVPLFNNINVRTTPSLTKGLTGVQYMADSTPLHYYDVVVAEGWYWLVYKRNNGGTGYCAYGTTDNKIKYWKIK